jgi:thiazole synthase ThiGH ThiG subunit
MESTKHKELYFKREILTRTISANECPLVTLTMKRSRDDTKKERKKVIAMMARQHPA